MLEILRVSAMCGLLIKVPRKLEKEINTGANKRTLGKRIDRLSAVGRRNDEKTDAIFNTFDGWKDEGFK